nr:uncharacterized protein LOC110355944 [Columba livia]
MCIKPPNELVVTLFAMSPGPGRHTRCLRRWELSRERSGSAGAVLVLPLNCGSQCSGRVGETSYWTLSLLPRGDFSPARWTWWCRLPKCPLRLPPSAWAEVLVASWCFKGFKLHGQIWILSHSDDLERFLWTAGGSLCPTFLYNLPLPIHPLQPSSAHPSSTTFLCSTIPCPSILCSSLPIPIHPLPIHSLPRSSCEGHVRGSAPSPGLISEGCVLSPGLISAGCVLSPGLISAFHPFGSNPGKQPGQGDVDVWLSPWCLWSLDLCPCAVLRCSFAAGGAKWRPGPRSGGDAGAPALPAHGDWNEDHDNASCGADQSCALLSCPAMAISTLEDEHSEEQRK